MTTETDLLPLPEYFRRDLSHMTWEGLSQAAINYASANVEHAVAPLRAEIETLREEIGRLLDSREREGDRLDWLLDRLPGDVIRDLVGEMSCTSDVGEWRDRIDKAARFKPPTP